MDKVFQTVDWAHTTNIYEVNVRQYTAEGTFAAFTKELPRLRDMGIETIWFMPVTPISAQNRKGVLGSYYACSDYVSVNPEFGSLDDLKETVREAHALGLKVIIDWVANHTGWDHSWTISNPEFYYKNDQGTFRPPFPEWEDTIHLNYGNPELRKAMIDAMKFWLRECDLDGFRCDMAHLVPLDFWKEARTELDAIKPLFWLAETEDVNYHEAFDASYAWEFLHTMERYWKKQIDIQGIDKVLHKYADVFPGNAIRAFFTSNHDENSHSGSEYERMGESARVFAVLCATWNSVPLIYSGQEMPLINKRLHFFEKDPIPWTGNYELHDFYKKLLGMRARNPAFRAGDTDVRTFRLETTNNAHVFAFLKKYQDHEAVILLNLSDVDQLEFDITGSLVNGIYTDIFSGEKINMDESKHFVMGKWGWVVAERSNFQ
ncbi:MAG: 1,4-alpha-glucan branching protein [Chitinophagaceae bacterium]|nr:1,4-alpha-glucan branching protein [Chitinophagaceae bacterium]